MACLPARPRDRGSYSNSFSGFSEKSKKKKEKKRAGDIWYSPGERGGVWVKQGKDGNLLW